jgi:hypothetical protein
MLFISQYGNINHKHYGQENRELYISQAIDSGYTVKIDVWFFDDVPWIGTNSNKQMTSIYFLFKHKLALIIEVKNSNAYQFFLDHKEMFHYFIRDNHRNLPVKTSKNVYWCEILSDEIPKKDQIFVMPEYSNIYSIKDLNKYTNSVLYGICSDYIEYFRLE